MPVFLSYVLLLVCALILAAIGVIISFLGEKACLSKQCVGQAKFIHRSVDKEERPCDDFYAFTCGRFHQFGRSIFDEIEIKQLKRLVEYLGVRADWDDDGRIEHIAKTLYQNCINDSQLTFEGLAPLKRIIAKLNGIPFLDPLWDYDKKADFKLVSNELKHFFNGLNSIFIYTRIIKMTSYPSLNPKNPANQTDNERKANMFPAYSIPIHLYTTEAPDPEQYLKYCIEFNEIYSKSLGTNKTITQKEKHEIKEAAIFKIKLLKLIDKTRKCSEQPFKFVDFPYDKRFGKVDPDKGKILTKLGAYVLKKAEPGDILASFAVVTPQFESYIDKLNELIKDVPDRVLANYMGVEGLIQMTPFLPSNLRDVYDKYMKSERDENNEVLSTRHLHCAKLTKDAMTSALSSEYLKGNPNPPDAVAILDSLTYQLLLQVKVILKRIKWATKRDRMRMLQLVNVIKVVSPLPLEVMQELQDKVSFELFYLIMCMNDDSTLESYLNVKVVRQLRNAQILNVKSETSTAFPYTIFHEDYDIFSTDIYFHRDRNVIVVPMAYLYYPALDSLWPKYLDMGGLAVWISFLLLKKIGYSNVQYPELRPEQPIRRNWWDKETISHYEKKRHCAFKEYNEYLAPFKVNNGDPNCLEDTLYYAAAVEASYLAYKEVTKMRFFVEPRLPYFLKYNVDQIFFIKFASSFCHYQGGNKQFMKNSDTAIIPKNFTVLYALRNFPKFSEIFKCDKDQKMTKQPCDLWGTSLSE